MTSYHAHVCMWCKLPRENAYFLLRENIWRQCIVLLMWCRCRSWLVFASVLSHVWFLHNCSLIQDKKPPLDVEFTARKAIHWRWIYKCALIARIVSEMWGDMMWVYIQISWLLFWREIFQGPRWICWLLTADVLNWPCNGCCDNCLSVSLSLSLSHTHTHKGVAVFFLLIMSLFTYVQHPSCFLVKGCVSESKLFSLPRTWKVQEASHTQVLLYGGSVDCGAFFFFFFFGFCFFVGGGAWGGTV